MKSSKAIEILTPLLREFRARMNPDERNAIQLSIEALKSHQKALKNFRYPEQFVLPGETLEVNNEATKGH